MTLYLHILALLNYCNQLNIHVILITHLNFDLFILNNYNLGLKSSHHKFHFNMSR